MCFTRDRVITWLAMIFLCLLSSCSGSINDSPSSTSQDQTITSVASGSNQSFATVTAAGLATPNATATARAINQTKTAVASGINQSFPSPNPTTPASTSPTAILMVNKNILHASSDCTISTNADRNNHSGWVCALTLTNNGTADLSWMSYPNSSNVGIYVQDTGVWNQGTVLRGQQQHVDFVVLGDTSTCSGSYVTRISTTGNSISVSWGC